MREETSNILRVPFAADDIDQLPRAGIMLDYVGHAAATARLLDADVEWNWQPLATDDGIPRIIRRDGCLELWIALTIDGTTRIGVGTVADAAADQDTAKELIGDAIRNAAMRFGVALDLWRKHSPVKAEAAPSGPPCPHCGAPVLFNEEKSRGKKPVWSCQNRGCGGGGLRDKADPGKGNWPWGSYDADFFASGDAGIQVAVTAPGTADVPAVPQDAFDDLDCNLTILGISKAQAEAELQTYRDNVGFAADHVKDIRFRVNRACVLLVALGLEKEGIQAELWREWQNEDIENRRILAWSTVKGSEIPSFARHVQAFLRLRQ